MPVYMYNLTAEALARTGKKPSCSKVAILGWAFLNNSDDLRNSLSESYRYLLIDAGVEVHDSHVLEYLGVETFNELNDVVSEVGAGGYIGKGFVYNGIKFHIISIEFMNLDTLVNLSTRKVLFHKTNAGKFILLAKNRCSDQNSHMMMKEKY